MAAEAHVKLVADLAEALNSFAKLVKSFQESENKAKDLDKAVKSTSSGISDSLNAFAKFVNSLQENEKKTKDLDKAVKSTSSGLSNFAKAVKNAVVALASLPTIDAGKLFSTLFKVIGHGALAAIKHLGSVKIEFRDLTEAGHIFAGVAGSIGRAIGESLKAEAERGNKGVQAMLVVFDDLIASVQGIVGAFVKDFAPAILPVVQMFTELAKKVANWADESDIGKSIAESLTKVVLVLGSAFAEVISIFVSGLAKVLDMAGYVAAAFNSDLAVSIDASKRAAESFGVEWNKTADTILTSLAAATSGQKEATKAEIEQLAGRSEAQKNAAEESKKSAEESEKSAKEAEKEREQARLEHSENLLEIDKEAAKTLEEMTAEIGENLIEQLDLRAEMEKATLEELNDFKNELLEQELERIDQTSTTEEEATQRKIELIQLELQNREMAFERREELEKNLLSEKNKAIQLEIKAEQNRAATIAAISTSAATQLIEGKKKISEVIVGTAAKAATDQINILGDQTQKELALLATAGSNEERQAALTMIREKGTMAAKFASAFAPLGPFAIPAAAAAIAAMTALINRFVGSIKFQQGGPVPGQGRGDKVPVLAEPDEFIVRRDVASSPSNRRFLDDFNATGDVSRAADRSGLASAFSGPGSLAFAGTGQLEIQVSFDRDPGDSLVSEIMRRINVKVLRNKAELIANRWTDS